SHLPAPPAPSPLSLHAALPICGDEPGGLRKIDHASSLVAERRPAIATRLSRRVRTTAAALARRRLPKRRGPLRLRRRVPRGRLRSEEHTSELQSRENLVCRLLL